MPHHLSREHFSMRPNTKIIVNKDEYVLGPKIGDGAVGVVYKATKVKNNKMCAIKFLAPDPKYIEEESFDDVSSRFKREGQRGAKLNHPCIIPIYDYSDSNVDEIDGVSVRINPFIVMDFIHGGSLENYIRRGSEERRNVFEISEERLRIALQIALGIEYLHEHKIVHRDIKPANIFLSQQTRISTVSKVILGDFGVVKWGDFHSSMATGLLTTTSQQGLGTMKYMSPEQAVAPKNVTSKSDIFSFGITLFELFTGQILLSPHHVFALMSARMMRGNAINRFSSLGLRINVEDVNICDLILDMLLRGVDGRPNIKTIRGRLEYECERRYEY